MSFEIHIDVSYFDHPKTVALIGLIGPEADIYPLRLWRWCALYAKSGKIPGGRATVEAACKWTGKTGRLYRSLVSVRFLKEDGEAAIVHDWMEHIGRSIHLYEAKKKKQRARYAAKILLDDGEHGAAENGILPEENGIIPPIGEDRREEDRIGEDRNTPLSPPKGGQGKFRRRRDEPKTPEAIEAELRRQEEAKGVVS